MSESNTQVAVRIQERFDAYLLGLIFTILALSIQTATFGASAFATGCELLAWLSLLFSGVTGLARMEIVPELYRLFGLDERNEATIADTERQRLRGVREVVSSADSPAISIDEFLRGRLEMGKRIKEKIDPMQARVVRRYRLMRYSFVVGLILLLVARAYPHIGLLLDSMR